MPSLEVPMSLKRDRGTRFVHLVTQLLFWQGLYPEDPEQDLDYHIQNLTPRLSRFILRHRYLKQCISWYRTKHPWLMLTFMLTNITVVHGVAIYHNWGDIDVVIENCYPMFLWIYIFVAMACMWLQMEKFNKLIIRFDKFTKRCTLDNDAQKSLIIKADVYCKRVAMFLHFIVFPSITIGLLYETVTRYLPKRQLYFRGWYPYDEFSSPAYEITILTSMIQISFLCLAANSLATTMVTTFTYPTVYFKIIYDKLRNIRTISIEAIRERKQNLYRTIGSRQLRGSAARFVSAPEMSRQGQRTWGVPWQGQNRRVNPMTPTRYGVTLDAIIREREYVNITDNEVENEMLLQLIYTAGLHQELLSLMTALDLLLHSIFLIMFVINIIVYGGTLLLLYYVQNISVKMVVLTITSFEVAASFLVLSILANLITDQSKAVVEACYASDWVDASTRFKRSMLIVMTRANVPVQFKAPGFDPLSVRNFGQVITLAYKTSTRLSGIVQK